jgi:integrase
VRVCRGDHDAAVALQIELRRELDDELDDAGPPDSLAAVCAEYADDRERLGRAESYVVELRRKVDELAETELGRTPAGELTATDLDHYYATLRRAGLGASSVRSWHKMIAAALALAVRREDLGRNVATSARPPSPDTPSGAAPDPAQVAAYLGAVELAHPTLGALLRLGALTGARRGELCALRWSDVDESSSTMRISRALTSPRGSRYAEGPTKSHKARTIALGAEAMAELMGHRARREALCLLAGVELDRAGFIFGPDDWPDGAVPFRPDYVTRRARELAELAGLPVAVCHPHGLRHYFATQGIAAGVDVVAMAEHLGHDPAVLLSTYAHALDDAKRAAADAVGKTLRR